MEEWEVSLGERLYAYEQPPSHMELVETSRWRVVLEYKYWAHLLLHYQVYA